MADEMKNLEEWCEAVLAEIVGAVDLAPTPHAVKQLAEVVECRAAEIARSPHLPALLRFQSALTAEGCSWDWLDDGLETCQRDFESEAKNSQDDRQRQPWAEAVASVQRLRAALDTLRQELQQP